MAMLTSWLKATHTDILLTKVTFSYMYHLFVKGNGKGGEILFIVQNKNAVV